MLPYFTAWLVTLITLATPSNTSAEQRLVEVMFARDVVNAEPVRPFEPGAYCEREPEPTGPIPVIDSQAETRVFFWSRFESSAEGLLRHSWYKDGVELYVVDLKIGKSPRWRSWSWKDIVPNEHAGKWKVVLSTVGEASEVICAAHFLVK
ncbi:MAG: DUF2914 domain-containing protein [Candidatus Binatia bacterium]